MYLGKYPEPCELPPGYRGVAISGAPESEKCESHAERERCTECDSTLTEAPHRKNGFLDRFLSHHLDFEDLLLLGLILMLLWSGADIECVLMLAMLFVIGL